MHRAAATSAAGLAALAALAVAGVASAQSSVTLFGVVDASVSHYTTKSDYFNNAPLYTFSNGTIALNPAALAFNPGAVYGAKKSQTALANSGYNSSRLGFRGTEDLGGGLAASFWLESSISNDDGAKGISNFNRRSTVSLSGGFGEVRLGRDYTPTFWNDTVFDPFGTNGVGTNLISVINGNLASAASSTAVGAIANPGTIGLGGSDNYVRTSNSIGYFLPANLGGFYGQVQYALHENVKNSSGYVAANTQQHTSPSTKGRYVGGRFGYANGPLDVAVAYGQSTAADIDTGLSTFSLAPFFGGSLLNSTNTAVTADRKINSFNLGASYDFGPVKLFGELSQVKDKWTYSTSTMSQATLSLPGLAPISASAGQGAFGSQTDKYNGWLVGATVPVGAGLIRAAFSRVKLNSGAPGTAVSYVLPNSFNSGALNPFAPSYDASANKFALGYVHNLSKRTALYATYSRTRIKDGYNGGGVMGATAGGSPTYLASGTASTNGWAARSATGYDFGIRHSF
ncbi:MAG: porin [Pseudomonadota bacterium]|nr:porin [Pseudomonadota bacterium]